MLLFTGILFSGCGTSYVAQPEPKDAAPQVDRRELAYLAQLPDPKVEKLSKSRGGNGPIYTVLGKTYRVMDAAEGYVQEGLASWYGTKFHGRRTSNGEVFDTYALSAAHKHLPIPIFVRVTNLDNGKKTIVRVNDRGPFHGDRIIDLSYAAAVKLGFHNKGTAKVRVEVVEPAPDEVMVHAGAFNNFVAAAAQQEAIQKALGVTSLIVKKSGAYRVRIGPIKKGVGVERLQAYLQTADVSPIEILAVP
ncbi:MAG: septal ring lytic transglycosylase RlpA family protein [Pseudomonadota bacterium]